MGLPSPCCIATAVATEEQSEEWEEGIPPLSKNARTSHTPVLYAWVGQRERGRGELQCEAENTTQGSTSFFKRRGQNHRLQLFAKHCLSEHPLL